ncbi:MAG: response regulator transcription factor [Marinobacter sp.]|uniref:response regulator transcription factor n=1 Tax=Marinobacter sp. TaxID=50741 RepID=UPI0034A059FE
MNIHSAGRTCSHGKADRPLSRVLIVDDHPFFSEGLAGTLEQEKLVRTVAKAGSIADAVDSLRHNPETSLILLNQTLCGETVLSLFQRLSDASVSVPVVVISSREDPLSIRVAKAAGAVGFLSKSSGRQALVRMVRCVSKGGLFYPTLGATADEPGQLTPRQLEALKLLAEGLPNKRICQALDLTEHTVKTHLKAIFTHLGVHNRTECVAHARALGLI